MDLSVQELEAAINYWRDRRPARGSELALSPEVNALATVYALMIFRRELKIDVRDGDSHLSLLLRAWRAGDKNFAPR